MLRFVQSHLRHILPVIAIGLLTLLAACGSSATAVPEPTATTAPRPTDAPPSSGGVPTPTPYAFAAPAHIAALDARFPNPPAIPPKPQLYGGVLHVATSVKPDMDPIRIRDSEWYVVWDQLNEWEAQWYFPEVQGTPTIRTNLAESWEMVDASTWNFKIKEGVKFHNVSPVNGRELTAADVKYSYDLLRGKPGWGGAEVTSVDLLDGNTVQFHTRIPLTSFPLIHTNGTTPTIFPKEAVEADGGLHKNPIGTGSFILKEFVPNEGVLFERNPNYHLKDADGNQLPFLDGLRYIFARGSATQMALFRAGQVDIMRMSSIDTLEQILETNKETTVYRVPSFGWAGYAVWLPLDQAPYTDKRVRQALSMAIDRRVVLEVVNRSDASMYGPFPWALAGFTEFSDYNLGNLGPAFQYNPEEAKRLLDEAVPGGLKLELEWGELQGFPFGDFAVLVSKYWEDIGVEVDLKQLESGTWQSKRRGGADVDNPMLSLVNTGSGPTAWDWVYAPYHSSLPNTINRPHVDDPKVDTLLDEWVGATSDRQLEIQKELFDYLGDQMYRIHAMVPPHYAIAQPYLIRAGNPYCWFPGFCSYEAKTAWMTNDRPDRKYEKFGQ